MIFFLADENFDNRITRGLHKRDSSIDLVTVQEVGAAKAFDPAILEIAANVGRVVLSHDVKTLVGHAYERIAAGLPMPGLVIAGRRITIRRAIEDIVSIGRSCDPSDLDRRVIYLPLKRQPASGVVPP